MAGHSDWEAELLSRRRSKDHQFKHDLDSPLLPSLRDRFTALAYYPPNAALRLPLQLQRNPEPEVVTLAMSTGATRPYLKWGWFEFPAEGQTVRLWAYRYRHRYLHDTAADSASAFAYRVSSSWTSGSWRSGARTRHSRG